MAAVTELPAGGVPDRHGHHDHDDHDRLRHAIRPALALVANATVLTALLVYFGWRRSETQAAYLGIDESILGMSTRDYALRSVGPVLTILVGVSVLGLAGTALDRRLVPLLQAATSSGRDRRARLALGTMGAAWVILPVLVWLAGTVWPATAYILFPAAIGAGIGLLLYATYLRHLDGPPSPEERRRNLVTYALGAVLVAVCLFWTASNYAEVLGGDLAQRFVAQVGSLPRVTATSERPLRLEGPGVVETALPATEGVVQYRYAGLRFLEHTGGRYFLVSDGWTPAYGVVFVLPDDDSSLRVDFVRDYR